ncbi:MAG TPA: TonB-dependent siderophore receptor [Solimonas sp.]
MSRPAPTHFRRRGLSAALHAAFAGSLVAAPLLPALAQADAAPGAEATVLRFDIPAGDLAQALSAAAIRGGVQLSFDAELTRGKQASGLSGEFTAREALARLLSGSGLELVPGPGSTYSLRPLPPPPAVVQLAPVRVEAQADSGFRARTQDSATKTTLSIRETPLSISVTTRESMEARQARILESALELTPGIAYTATPNPGAFGGQGLRHFGNAFVLRNQELNGDRDIRTDGFSTGNVSVIDLAAYERVEVIKGPSGFYGQGSVGGFINQVRRKPKAEYGATVATQLGSFDTYRVESDVTGSLTRDQSLRGRMTLAYDDAGSFVHGVENQHLFLAPSLEVVLSERTRALFQALHQDERFLPNPGFPTLLVGDRIEAPKISRSLFVGVPNTEEATDKTTEASLRIDHELNRQWLVSLLLQGNRIARRGTHENYAYGLSANGDVYLYTQRATVDQDRWAGELRLDGRFEAWGAEHQLTAGVERNQRDGVRRQGYAYIGAANIYLQDFDNAGSNAPLTGWRTDRRYIIDNQALYLQTALSLGQRSKLLMSARYDEAQQRGETFFQGTPEAQQSYSKNKLTFRGGLTHDFSQQVTAYAAYAQSFIPQSALARSGSLLEPESGEGYELGLKTEWFGGQLAANLAAYQQEQDKRPLRDPSNGPGESFYISSGPHRSRGLELEVSGSPLAGLTVGSAVSLSNNEFRERSDPYYGLSFHGSVDRQHSLYLHYQWNQGPMQGLGLGATWVHVGERQYIRGTSQIYADGYDRVDLNLSCKRFQRFDIGLQVRNLLDERYLEATGYTGVGNYFGSPTAALLRVEYRLAP